MLQILNKTPFEAVLALFTDQYGAEKVAVAVKATFNIPSRHGQITLADKQLPPLYSDEYFGEPGKSSIKYPADVILGKVNTNIGLIGSAHSPGQKPVKQLPVSLKVGPLEKIIQVTGNRQWKKNTLLPGFHMTKPEPFVEMPLVYERAFGGVDDTHKKEKKHGWDRRNPIGTGFRLNEGAVEGQRLPNLEDPNHLISNWKDKPPVASFGFIDSSWEPRLKFAGTYDDAWLKDQFPLLPLDLDLRFFNSSTPDLTAKGFLTGGEPVKMVNLSKKGTLEFKLPRLKINLMFRLGESRNPRKANLWTIIFEPDEDRFYMVWGQSFPIGKQPTQMRYVKVEMEGDKETLDILTVDSEKKERTENVETLVGSL